MPELTIKKVVLSQIVEDLANGLSRWKTDDIGFGSLEKKYNLQRSEMIELLAHPKIKNVQTRIPTFIIEDDLADEEVAPVITTPRTTTIEVAQPQVAKIVKSVPKKEVKAFI